MIAGARPVAVLLSPVLPARSGSGRAMRAWTWVEDLAATHDLQVWIPEPPREPPVCWPAGVGLCCGGDAVGETTPVRRRLGWLLPPLVLLDGGRATADWRFPRDGRSPFAGLLKALGGREIDRLVVFRLYLHPLGRTLREQRAVRSFELDMDDLESLTRRSVAAAQWRLRRPLEALLRAAEAWQYRLLEGRVAAGYDRVWLAAAEDSMALRARRASAARRIHAAGTSRAPAEEAAVRQRPNRLPNLRAPACQDRGAASGPPASRESCAQTAGPSLAIGTATCRDFEAPSAAPLVGPSPTPCGDEPTVPDPTLELLFVGGLDYPPNEEALRFLLRAVLPELSGRLARPWRLTVVGRGAGPSLRGAIAHQPAVELLSDLVDLSGCYARCQLVLVPLRAGGGSKLKTLEAFARGRAVLATPEGVRGLSVRPGLEFRLALDAREFVTAIVELSADATERRRLARAGHRFYERHRERQTG